MKQVACKVIDLRVAMQDPIRFAGKNWSARQAHAKEVRQRAIREINILRRLNHVVTSYFTASCHETQTNITNSQTLLTSGRLSFPRIPCM